MRILFATKSNKMKRLILSLATFLVVGFVYAQKPSADAADAALGKGELDKAKELIDGAVANEVAAVKAKNDKLRAKGKDDKTKPEVASTKSIFTKGKVYQALATADNEAFQKLSDNPIEIAMDAYNWVLENEKETSPFYLYTDQQIGQFYANVFNKAIENYNSENIRGAMYFFESAALIQKGDTSALENAFNMASQLTQDDPAMKERANSIAEKLFALDFHKPIVYRILIQYALEDENVDEALRLVKAGRKANPEDNDLLIQEINIYINAERTEEAIASLEEGVEKNPGDKLLVFNLGILHDRSGNADKAVEYYNKAIEIDPKYYEAHYSVGAIYYNKASEILKERNNLPASNGGQFLDQDKAKELMDKAKEQFKQALAPFETALETKPDELEVVQPLVRVYELLDMKDKYESTRAKLEKLTE